MAVETGLLIQQVKGLVDFSDLPLQAVDLLFQIRLTLRHVGLSASSGFVSRLQSEAGPREAASVGPAKPPLRLAGQA
jgi:hypothetical protein